MKSNTVKVLFLILFVLCIVGCQQGMEANTKKDKLNNDGIIVRRETVMSDGATKLIINNQNGLDNTYVEDVSSDLKEAFKEISSNYKNKNYEWEDTITVNLNGSDGVSNGMKNIITLYNVVGGNHLAYHELTHTLLGFGNLEANEFNTSNGYFTQEGIAVYLQERLDPEKKVFPTNSLKLDTIIRYLYDNKRLIPIEELISSEHRDEYYNSNDQNLANELLWKSYVQSGSFVKYLIDQYGKDNFLKIYNSSNLEKDIRLIYKKDIKELEKDWLHSIKSNNKPLNMDEKFQILFP
ncbi:peptidase MA family metallohydrolase [Priestia flexa]|uniref:peptidase MA family metallohydrolase n=1 Tax=Priestia flexa TaxID=86664 RepID=UPI001CD4A6AD|nr:hypothetical protein [Priestia flexa]MCA1203936.1 hypothetical protein [Priestia flexa]